MAASGLRISTWKRVILSKKLVFFHVSSARALEALFEHAHHVVDHIVQTIWSTVCRCVCIRYTSVSGRVARVGASESAILVQLFHHNHVKTSDHFKLKILHGKGSRNKTDKVNA